MKRTHEDTIRPILNEDTATLEGFQVSPEAARRNRVNRRAFLRGDTPCRSLQIQTTAQDITGGGVYELCRQPDGTWAF